MKINFCYIEYGNQQSVLEELRYSLSTLRAEGIDPQSISILTDDPARYDGSPFDIVDISQKIQEFIGASNYIHRIKPYALLNYFENRDIGSICFLDADTYIKRGFLNEVKVALNNGIGMNFFVRNNPYPNFTHKGFNLSNGIFYVYTPKKSIMYNSGVIALKREQKYILSETIELIDKLRNDQLHEFDLEQFALSEAIRINKIFVTEIKNNIEHYHSRWKRRYIHWRLDHMNIGDFKNLKITRPIIHVSKTIVRLFKAWSILKNLQRKLFRL